MLTGSDFAIIMIYHLLFSGAIPYQGITMSMSKSGGQNSYWSIQETNNCTQNFISKCGDKILYDSTLFFVTFNQRVAPETVSLITGPGYVPFIVTALSRPEVTDLLRHLRRITR